MRSVLFESVVFDVFGRLKIETGRGGVFFGSCTTCGCCF